MSSINSKGFKMARHYDPSWKVHRDRMYVAIGCNSGRLPPDEEQVFGNVAIPKAGTMEGIICHTTVIVKKTAKLRDGADVNSRSIKHRIYILCPKCGREIPMGRLHQHVGTKSCKTANQQYEVVVGNVGTVYEGVIEAEALDSYTRYKTLSGNREGRAAGEEVSMFVDGHLTHNYVPRLRAYKIQHVIHVPG